VVDTVGGGFTKNGAELSDTRSSAASSLPAEQVLRKVTGSMYGTVQAVSVYTVYPGESGESKTRKNEKKSHSELKVAMQKWMEVKRMVMRGTNSAETKIVT